MFLRLLGLTVPGIVTNISFLLIPTLIDQNL